ncbi:hypothetical protein DH2020_025426 [Rehmannia glutinosa]|uniref:Uncharacterized protein n=1 Tax=Rehmannia glutinosa TaxID=99300 RepID=A0ABR0W3M6_REHGL
MGRCRVIPLRIHMLAGEVAIIIALSTLKELKLRALLVIISVSTAAFLILLLILITIVRLAVLSNSASQLAMIVQDWRDALVSALNCVRNLCCHERM